MPTQLCRHFSFQQTFALLVPSACSLNLFLTKWARARARDSGPNAGSCGPGVRTPSSKLRPSCQLLLTATCCKLPLTAVCVQNQEELRKSEQRDGQCERDHDVRGRQAGGWGVGGTHARLVVLVAMCHVVCVCVFAFSSVQISLLAQ